MPKPTKQFGFEIVIKAFVPAGATDKERFADVQNVVAHTEESVTAIGGTGTFDITPTRR